MKSYEEMTENVLRRAEQEKKKRQKMIYTTAASLTCACMVAVMGFTAWKMSNTEPPVSLDGAGATATENTHTNPIILQKPTEDITTPTAPLPTEPPYPIGNGGTPSPNPICTVHMPQAHEFDARLIDYVGEDSFMEWVEGGELLNITEGCRIPSRTIYEFIKYFDVPKSVFEEIYYSSCYPVDYFDVDLFYSGDEEAIEAFLRDKDTAEKILDKRLAFDELRHGVYAKFEKAFKEKFGDVSYHKVTFADMVRELNVPRELLEDYSTKTTTGRSYNYVFDLLYLKPGESVKLKNGETVTYDDFNAMLAEAANAPYPVRAADAIICGVEDYRTQ